MRRLVRPTRPRPRAARSPPARTITPGPPDLPGDLARGRGGRVYPPLRGGVVKLAHDDPGAAAELLAGLGPALHAIAPSAIRLDLQLAERDQTLALDADPAAATTAAASVASPRGRGADVRLRTDAVTLAEAVAGVGPAPRRFGALRAVRGRRAARALASAVASAPVTLADLVAAGARPDPALALRAFAYAVPRAWTRGHEFVVTVTVDDVTTGLAVHDGAGIEIDDGAAEPDVGVAMDRAGFQALLSGSGGPALEGPQLAALRQWAVRLGALPG